MTSPRAPLRFLQGRLEHEPFVRRLSREAFGRFGNYERILPPLLSRPWIRTVIAEADGRPVGFAMLSLVDLAIGELDLTAIAVLAQWRSRGVGRALLEQVGRVARSVSAGSIRLTVAEDNGPARKLFEGAGYRLVRGDEGRYPRGQPSVTLRLEL